MGLSSWVLVTNWPSRHTFSRKEGGGCALAPWTRETPTTPWTPVRHTVTTSPTACSGEAKALRIEAGAPQTNRVASNCRVPVPAPGTQTHQFAKGALKGRRPPRSISLGALAEGPSAAAGSDATRARRGPGHRGLRARALPASALRSSSEGERSARRPCRRVLPGAEKPREWPRLRRTAPFSRVRARRRLEDLPQYDSDLFYRG